jgi:hypothetical protein
VSTTTVSVRDGWLTVRSDHEFAADKGSANLALVRFVRDGSRHGVAGAWVAGEIFAPGVAEEDVMELIHAGSGTIVREVP